MWNYRITALLRLEKTSKIPKSNCWPTPTMPTDHMQRLRKESEGLSRKLPAAEGPSFLAGGLPGLRLGTSQQQSYEKDGAAPHSCTAASSMQFISPDFLVFVLLFWEERRAARGPSHRDV